MKMKILHVKACKIWLRKFKSYLIMNVSFLDFFKMNMKALFLLTLKFRIYEF